MKSIPRSLLLAASLAIAACAAPAPPPVPAPPPSPPGLSATGTAERVVLLCFDGLSADAIAQFGAPELQTVLGAAGRGVPTRVIPQAKQTDIAPFVRQLLGLH